MPDCDDAHFRASASCQNNGKLQEFQITNTEAINLIALTVNGEARRFDQPINCLQLLERLELAGKRIALERNGEIVPRSRHGVQMLADGDTLEIVVAVGGG